MRNLKIVGCLAFLALSTLTVNAQSETELKTTAKTLYGPVNIITNVGVGLAINSSEALWYNGTYFSWGYGGQFNFFADRVGIGTVAPDARYMLSVNGAIRAKEVVVESGWADFVFEDDYKLRSLREVESYIKKNGHLPEIPSAKEVQENGVKVAESVTKLLHKIEELTLYTIAQQKEINRLKEQFLDKK